MLLITYNGSIYSGVSIDAPRLGKRVDMKTRSRVAAATAALVIAASAFVGIGATSAQAANGNANIAGWCGSTYPGSVAVTVSPHNAYSWRCRVRNSAGGYHYIQIYSMTEVCRYDHSSRSRAYILNNDWENPRSWRCTA